MAEPAVGDEAGVVGVNGELIVGSAADVEVPAWPSRGEGKKGDGGEDEYDRYKLRNGREVSFCLFPLVEDLCLFLEVNSVLLYLF